MSNSQEISQKTSQETFVNTLWYGKYNWLGWLLSPFSLLFWGLSTVRRNRQSAKQTASPFPVPVVVIGNISVGGVGKTPLIISLCEQLKAQRMKVGVVSRGYGGKSDHYPLLVTANLDANASGDEPLLIAQQTGCPVVVDHDRTAAVNCLLKHYDVDIVLSDDGLQHYHLWRDIEIVVIDGARGVGNGLVLPGGPLRETVARVASVDAVLVNGNADHRLNKKLEEQTSNVYSSRVAATQWRKLSFNTNDKSIRHEVYPLDDKPIAGRTLAFAGIGNPDRFYSSLRELGVVFEERNFSDHYHYCASDLLMMAELGLPLITTAKDAVKIAPLLSGVNELQLLSVWVLDVGMAVPEPLLNRIIEEVNSNNG